MNYNLYHYKNNVSKNKEKEIKQRFAKILFFFNFALEAK